MNFWNFDPSPETPRPLARGVPPGRDPSARTARVCMRAPLRGRLRLALCETRSVALALGTCGTCTETGPRRPLRVSWPPQVRTVPQPPWAESKRAHCMRLCLVSRARGVIRYCICLPARMTFC